MKPTKARTSAAVSLVSQVDPDFLPPRAGRLATAIGIAILAMVGAGIVAYAADPSPVGFSDSVAYLVAGQNFASGRGLGLFQASGDFSPMLHFPPLYSAVLSLPVAAGFDALAGARWINALAFGSLVLLAAILAHRVYRNGLLAISLAALVVFTPGIFALFVGVLSEVLFLPLVVGCLLALTFDRGRRRWMAALAGILASLAILTRYAGIALLIVGPVIIYLDRTSTRGDRLLRATIFALTALSLPLLRTAYLGVAYGVMLPRTAAATSVSWDSLGRFRGDVTLALWQLLPFTASLPRLTYRQMLGGLAILGLAFAVLMVVADRVGSRLKGASAREGGRRWIGPGVFVIAYVGTLGLSYALTTPTPDINYRILAPAQVPVWILLPIPLLALTRHGSWARWIAPAALLAAAAVGAPQTLELARETRANGGGLMTPAWRNSETVEYVIRAGPGAVISNETAALQLWASRPAYDLPDVMGPVETIDLRYGDASEDPVQRIFREGSATLVLFDSIRGQLINIYGDDADRRYEALIRDLEVVADFADGTVYAYPR